MLGVKHGAMDVPMRGKAKAVQLSCVGLVWFGLVWSSVRKLCCMQLVCAGEGELVAERWIQLQLCRSSSSARPRPTDCCRQCKETKTKQPRPRFLFRLQHDTGLRATASNATTDNLGLPLPPIPPPLPPIPPPLPPIPPPPPPPVPPTY